MSRSSLLVLGVFIVTDVLFGALLFNSYQASLDQRLSYALAPEVPDIGFMHLAGFLAGSLILALGMFAFRYWLASSRRLRTISEHMAEGMYVMDASGQTLYANPAAFDILGYSAEELLGRRAHELFHIRSGGEAVRSEQYPILNAPLSGDVLSSEDELFQCKDGRRIRVQVTSSPLREKGRVTGAVVLFRDITDAYEAQLRFQQTDIAFQHLSEAVLTTGPDVLIRAVNRAFVTITGYSEQEVLGKNPSMLSSGRHSREFYAELWRTLHSEGLWRGEIWNRRKNGEIYPEWTTITAVRDQAGKVLSYVSVFSDDTEQRRREQRLIELAYHDALTGLPNRAAFLEVFEHTLRHAERSGRRIGLLFMDLDRFKHINDTLGHEAGDKLLVQVAQRLRKLARESDILARMGGDEFTLVLEDLKSPRDCAFVARKLLLRLAEPFEIDERKLFVSVSIGISIFPQDGRSVHSVLKNADAAMYRAKHAGRSDFCFFTVEMARQEAERFQLEQDLRRALERDELRLLYQPKVDVASQRIIGLEALLRWHRSRRDVLTPPAFLGVASEAGLMPEITAWVVSSAARQLQQWFGNGLEPGRIAVNLDGDTCNIPGVSERLNQLIGEFGATPDQFEIEITETVILHHISTDLLLYELSNDGFILAIDDFGTGESSLFRLKQLPVQSIKVDRTFVQDIEDDPDDRAIFRAIVTMVKSLGMKIVAEGVETHYQMEFLRSIGCDQVQGYLYSRPVPPEQITEMLREQRDSGQWRLGGDWLTGVKS